MGLKMLMKSGLSPVFLRMGLTAASLSVWGIEPELKGELLIFVMSEEMARRQSLTRVDVMGSRAQVELLIPNMMSDSSIGDSEEN